MIEFFNLNFKIACVTERLCTVRNIHVIKQVGEQVDVVNFQPLCDIDSASPFSPAFYTSLLTLSWARLCFIHSLSYSIRKRSIIGTSAVDSLVHPDTHLREQAPCTFPGVFVTNYVGCGIQRPSPTGMVRHDSRPALTPASV